MGALAMVSLVRIISIWQALGKKKKTCMKKEPCVGKKDNVFLIITYILFPNLKMGLKLSGF